MGRFIPYFPFKNEVATYIFIYFIRILCVDSVNWRRVEQIIEEEGIDRSQKIKWPQITQKVFNLKTLPNEKKSNALFYAYHKQLKSSCEQSSHTTDRDDPSSNDTSSKHCSTTNLHSNLKLGQQVLSSCRCGTVDDKNSHYHCPNCNGKYLKWLNIHARK